MGVTKMAGGAFLRQDHARMVLICIHGKNLGRAEFHADAASLAPGGKDRYFASGTFCRGGWRFGG